MALALFDLDHTLLSGDSDSLCCEFLVRRGLLLPERLALNAEMDAGFRDCSVPVADYCNFHVGSLTGESLALWSRWREAFLAQATHPRHARACRSAGLARAAPAALKAPWWSASSAVFDAVRHLRKPMDLSYWLGAKYSDTQRHRADLQRRRGGNDAVLCAA